MKSLFVAAFICCLPVTFVAAQEWASTYKESIDLYNNFESQKAKVAAEKALRLYKQQNESPDKNLLAILRQLSLICYDLNLLDQALTYSKEELALMQKLDLSTTPGFASAAQNLALIHIAQNNYEAAEPLLREALTLSLNFNGEDSYEVNAIKGNLASTLFHLEQDEETLTLFTSSIAAMDQLEEVGTEYYTTVYDYGSYLSEHLSHEPALSQFKILEEYYNFETPNFEYASILITIGDELVKLNRLKDAEAKYLLATGNLEQINDQDSDEYGIALNNLSVLYQKLGQFDQSEELIQKLLSIREVKKETAPRAYASSLAKYANIQLKNGLITKAHKYLLEAEEFYTSGALQTDNLHVIILENLALVNYNLGFYEVAKEQIDQALYNSTEPKGEYSILEKKSRIQGKLGQFSGAQKTAEKALEKSIAWNGAMSLATCYVKNTLAQILTELGKYAKAEKLYQEIIPQFKTFFSSVHPEYATVITNYSSLLQLRGSYYIAEDWLKIAVEIKKNAFGEQHPEFLTSYENLGLLYQNTARYTEAMIVFEEIKNIKEEAPDETAPSLAYTYNNLGNVKKQLAEYTEAESYLKQSKTLYEESIGKQHVYYASLINSLALLYQKMGNVEVAKPLMQESLRIYESLLGKNNPEYATALENLATLYQMEGNSTEAKTLLEEVLVIDETILGKEHPLYSKTLHNLAAVYEENEEHEKARNLYNQALAIAEKQFGTNHPSYASTLYNLAVLEQELENYTQAKAHYMKVVDIRLSLLGEFHPDYTYASYGLASIFHKTNELELAKSLYLEVITKYSDDIAKYFPALSESEKSAFWAKIRPVFEAFMDYAVEFVLLNKGSALDRNEMIGTLYDVQLRTKALLLNATNKVRKSILTSGDQVLISSFNEWLALKENIVKAYAMSKEEVERSELNIAQLEQRANDMEKKLSLSSSSFSQTFDQSSVTWKNVRDKLGEGESAIEIIRIKKRVKSDSIIYVSLLIDSNTQDAPKMSVNPSGVVMENKGFSTYKNSIVYKIKDTKSYQPYWSSIDQLVSDATRVVYLSSDGVYNKINLSTLFDPVKGEYVIDKYAIRLLSNTKEVVSVASASGESKSAALYGFPKYDLGARRAKRSSLFNKEDSRQAFGEKIAPLPGTYREVTDIEKELFRGGWKYDKLLEEKATEADIKKLNSPVVLHIATHGFFLPDIHADDDQELSSRTAKYNPLLRSGLLLAGAENTINNQEIPGEEDGILTAYEAMNLSLDNTQLVVMSACETGLGEVRNGEGVYGLQRSFLVAGADNLIMSLWKVNDETTQMLMSGFYKNWINGESKLDAFNHTIADLKKEFKEPYYWGAFVMLGK